MIPKQPIYTTCLYDKYHTNFTSQFYKIKATTLSSPTVSSSIDIFLTISNKYFNSITNKFPASPISKPQLSQLFNPPQLPPVFNTDKNPISIIAHTHYAHTCVICKIKDLPYIDTKNKGHSPDYTITILLKNKYLIYCSYVFKLSTISNKPLLQT